MNFADILRFDTPCHFTSVDKICFHKTTEKSICIYFSTDYLQAYRKSLSTYLLHRKFATLPTKSISFFLPDHSEYEINIHIVHEILTWR